MRLDHQRLALLRASLRGQLLLPEDLKYEEAIGIWNARLARRPGAVVRCASSADVQAAVHFARESGLPTAVKGGGHDFAGNSVCRDGLVIDLARLNAVEVVPDQGVVRVGGGATWGDVDQATQVHGLATPAGTVSTVGVGGYTLGGGTGHLTRRFGLALDNVLSAEIVTADGQMRKVSEREHPDLFWALRGGSGNFGVVTSFEFQLHRVGPEVLAGQIIHPLDDAPQVLTFYREFMLQAPVELQCYAFIVPIPPLDVFPADLHGRPALDLVAVYSGAPAQGQKVIKPLRVQCQPLLDDVTIRSYVEVQKMFDPGVEKGNRWCSRGQYLSELSDEAITTALRYAQDLHGEFTMAYFEPLGGAVGRADHSTTAFAHRDAAYSFHIMTGWISPDNDGKNVAWTREFHQAMASHAPGGVYVNLLSRDEAHRIPEAYGTSYQKLAYLKSRYDPENLFRFNQNIPPSRST